MAGPAQDWDLLSSYAGLLSLAMTSIYAGSFGSLSIVKTRESDSDGKYIDDDDEEEEINDRLSASDAWWFPVIGSFVLFGLYLVVKYVGKEWINFLLQWYFTIAGVGSVGKSFISLVRWTVGDHQWKQFDKNRIVLIKGRKEFFSISLRTPSLFLMPLGAIPSIIYTFGTNTTRRSALLTDVLALSFSHNALSLLKLDSFKTGCVLLSGLFFYDIWWVFGTEVMVKVATTLDVPIKLLWTKSLTFSTERGFTMLGLGDIVIPGMFIALALRFDYHQASRGSTPPSSSKALASSIPIKSSNGFRKPYFTAALVAYALGLGTTMSVMHFFRAAQPALLYLSPACILSFFITAVSRGEFKKAWEWSDAPEEKEDGHPELKDGDAAGTTSEDSTVNGKLTQAVGVGEETKGTDGEVEPRRNRVDKEDGDAKVEEISS